MELSSRPAGMHGDRGLQGVAAAIYSAQRRRYSASSHGTSQEKVAPDIGAVIGTAFAGVALGALGFGVVLLQ